MPRPPLTLVRAPKRARTPFDALLEAAARDPEAASGLALAYAEMGRDARARLIQAVAEDPNALLLLLGVEEDAGLARSICSALRRPEAAGPREGAGADEAFAWGDLERGGVGLVRRLHGAFVDALRVGWEGDAVEAEALPLCAGGDGPELRRRIGAPPTATSIPFERGIDLAAEALWRARRAGLEMPAAARPFADLFRPPRRP